MSIRRVLQEDTNGCGLACLAMITDQTYQQVKTEVTHIGQHGISVHCIESYLVDRGYALSWKYLYRGYTNQRRDEWPPALWANVHIAQVRIPNGSHFIVVLFNGEVLDPLTPAARRFEDYTEIDNIVAIYKCDMEIELCH